MIPGGTLNHLATDLGIPESLEEALRLASRASAQPIDAGTVNGHLFLNTSSVGTYVTFVRMRERLERYLGYRLASLVAGIRLLLRPPRLHRRGRGRRTNAIRRHTPRVHRRRRARAEAPHARRPRERRPAWIAPDDRSREIARANSRTGICRGGARNAICRPESRARRVRREPAHDSNAPPSRKRRDRWRAPRDVESARVSVGAGRGEGGRPRCSRVLRGAQGARCRGRYSLEHLEHPSTPSTF